MRAWTEQYNDLMADGNVTDGRNRPPYDTVYIMPKRSILSINKS